MALPDEVFKQRLYELAKDNEDQPAEATKVEAVTSGDAALEGMLGDLLAALRKEEPKDPLSEEQVKRAGEAAEATVKGKDDGASEGYTTAAPVEANVAPGPSAGLLAAVKMAGDMMKGTDP
eukprot:symbB.v1.2.021579.t1/scaffold1870.1/size97822/2